MPHGREHGVDRRTERAEERVTFRGHLDAGVAGQLAANDGVVLEEETRVLRIGIHTGEGVLAGDGYVGMDVHRVARVSAAGHGGQILLTAATAALLDGHWPAGASVVPLGAYRLKDLPVPETQGRTEAARERIEESMRLFAPAGDVSAILLHLADFATLAAREGDDERELRLAGALDHLKRLTGTDVVDHPVNAIPGLSETVTRCGPEAELLLAEGAAMSIDEVVRYALREPLPAN